RTPPLPALEPVPLKLQRVAIDPLTGPGRCRAEALQPLFQPAATALEYPDPHLGTSQAEEREVHAEAVVFPGRRAGLAEQVVQPFLTFCRQPVDDLGTARPVERPADAGI